VRRFPCTESLFAEGDREIRRFSRDSVQAESLGEGTWRNEGDTSVFGASVKAEKSLKKVSERNFLTAILNFLLKVTRSLSVTHVLKQLISKKVYLINFLEREGDPRVAPRDVHAEMRSAFGARDSVQGASPDLSSCAEFLDRPPCTEGAQASTDRLR